MQEGQDEVKHFSVMLSEVLTHLIWDVNGIYIDCTFGAGGHSRAILRKLSPQGTLIGVDIDPSLSPIGKDLEEKDNRFKFLNLNYSSIYSYWTSHNLPKVSGILLDLGVSTIQLKDKNRTFSYNQDNLNLEFRFGLEGKSVYKILNFYTFQKLNFIFKKYGEISDSKKISNAIVSYRNKCEIRKLDQLKEIVEKSKILNSKKNKNPLKLIFQALRIECNSELYNLNSLLSFLPHLLKQGGKVLIITFQSLEDELIIEWRGKYSKSLNIPDYGTIIPPLFIEHHLSPLLPTRWEIERNWASRSAKLWIFTKS